MIVTARDLKVSGVAIQLEALLSAINRAKPVAEDFDQFLELNQRLDRGDAGCDRPLGEIVDELRSKDLAVSLSNGCLLSRRRFENSSSHPWSAWLETRHR